MRNFKNIVLVGMLALVGVACSSTSSLDKEVKKEASKTKAMTGEQIVMTFKKGIKSGNFSEKKKKELLGSMDKFIKIHQDRTAKSRKLVTLAINNAAKKDYPLSKIRAIMVQFEKNEKAIVKNKIEFLSSMRIFIQDKLDSEYEKQMVRDLLMESDFMDRETLYQMK